MQEELKIIKITDSNDPVLDVVSNWIYQWYEKDAGRMLSQVREYYRHSVFSDRLPQTFVAFKGNKPVGTFQFGISDNYVRPDVYPWLKNVYVDHVFRGNGYGDAMLKAVAENAGKAGIKELYLFTHIAGFYEKHGWEFLEEFETHSPMYGKQRLYVLKF